MLFTHRGLSGPAILQISSYWQETKAVYFNFLPDENADSFFSDLRKKAPKENCDQQLKIYFPKKIRRALFAGSAKSSSSALQKRD